MSPGPQHGTPAGNAILAIRSLARQSGADVQELMTLYALEEPISTANACSASTRLSLRGY